MLQHLVEVKLENSPGPVVSLPTMRSATRYDTSTVLKADDMFRFNLVDGTWFRMVRVDLGQLPRLAVSGSAMTTSQ